MSRKMKQIMLAVILMVMMCAVSPARKVSAEVLNSPQQIVWGQSYSGELEDAQNTYEYTFTMKKSGTFSLAIVTEGIGKTHTGLNYIKVSDMYDNEIYTASVSEGNGSYKAELLAGDYKLSLCAGFYTGCKFTFTASYKASGETRSEAWLSQNDEKTMAFTYDEIKEKKYSLSAGQYFDVKIEYVELSQDEFNARIGSNQSRKVESSIFSC